MRRRIKKQFVWLGLILFATVMVCEGLAKIAMYYGLNIRTFDYSRYYSQDPNLNRLTWLDDYQVHPYFGYDDNGIRRFELLRENLTANDFVIGVLGGSVAERFAEYATNEPEVLADLHNAI